MGKHPRFIGGNNSLFFEQIADCRRCQRLVAYCEKFKEKENCKVTNFDYWAKPVPGFGDLNAELLIIGLAPGAHGANRTGRPFTGDHAGDVLYRALHRNGFSNRLKVSDKNDGLQLWNTYITNSVKCVPPSNRPIGQEKKNCLEWLEIEIKKLCCIKVVLAMGKDAFDSYLHFLKRSKKIKTLSHYHFSHGCTYQFPGDNKVLLATYHFSRYNMNTGVLTEEMIIKLFSKIKALLLKK